MDLVPQHRCTVLNRRGSALILAAIVAALTMAIASPAQATPNVATAWGLNESGQLGDGTNTGPEKCGAAQKACSTTPVAVNGLSGVMALAGGGQHSLALLEAGTVMAWGKNTSGQLGNGTTTNSNVPVAASGLSGVTAIAAGASHSLALLSNGTVMAWGANRSGQLGDGTTTDSDVPVAVSGLSGVTAIAAGEEHSLAVLSNGTVMAWGANENGQLGNGTTTKSNVPVAVSGLSGVRVVSAGSIFSLALLNDGTVMAWGYNENGQLGNGTTTQSDVPVAVSTLSAVSAISAGGFHSLARLSNGTVMAWGRNLNGQLGDGTSTGPEQCGANLTACAKTPVAVSNLSGVSIVAGGGEHSLALLTSGSLMAWGRNGNGQLGDGTSTGPEACSPFANPCSTTPILTTTHGVDVGIAAGEGHSLAFGPPPPPPTKLPELGRCVEAKGLTGAYKNHFCVSPGGGRGRDNWLPGPGEKKKFEGTGSATTLQTAKHKIICSTTIIDGEYLSAKTATATVILKGCINAATKATCQSNPANTGEIETTQPLEGELGFIKGGTTPSVGLDLKKSSVASNVASFSCGGPPQPEFLATVEGSVIAPLKPIDIMVQEFTLTYNVTTAGKQVPERFEGGLKDTLSVSFAKGAEKPVEEEAGLKTTVTISNEERLEIKAK